MITKRQARVRWLIVGLMLVTLWALPVHTQSREDRARGQKHFDTGNELMGKGDLQSAIASYSEAIVLLPKSYLPYMNRAIAYLTLGRLSEAEADAVKSLSLFQPTMKDSNLHLATIYQVKGTLKQYRREYTSALELFDKAIETEPTAAKFYDSQATALRLLGREKDAIVSYNKAIELDKREPIFFNNRAALHARLGDTVSAIADLDEALKLDKNASNAYYTRASIRMASEEFDEALNDLNEAIRIDPRKAIYFHARGILHNRRKQYDLAIKDHTQAISVDANLVVAHADRAIAYAAMKNLRFAIEDMRSAIRIDNGSAVLRYNLGYFLYQDRQYSEALKVLTEAISISPKWAAPYVLRSNCYVVLKRSDEALADRKIAKELGSSGRPSSDRYTFFEVEARPPDNEEN